MRTIIALLLFINSLGLFAQTPELIPFLKGKRWGFVNAQREIVVPCMYDYVYPFSEGLALVELERKFGYINAQGKTVIPLKYDKAQPFKQGRAKVETIFGKRTNGQFKVGYIDKTGKEIIPLQYLGLTNFRDNMATIWDGDYNGYIDYVGKVLVKPQYKFASRFSESRAWVATKMPTYDMLVGCFLHKEAFLIDAQGKQLHTIKNAGSESFSEGLCLIIAKTNDSTVTRYFIDKQGKKVLDVSDYDAVHGFTEGLAAVMKNNKLGFIDRAGKLVIPCQYSINFKWFYQDHKRTLFNFKKGLTAVMLAPDQGWNVIDKQGKTKLPRNYQYLRVATSTQILAKRNNHWGIISPEGEIILPLQYQAVKPFKNGLALVRKGRKWFYVDRDGNEYFEE
ncbi:hypothetical protein BKI52_23535 [marine bacterium AO1-C]|nr:hypothetical protein BKI52_23535 [marine bacterium AO1-C]